MTVHHKYWIKRWQNHNAFYEVGDLLEVNNAYITQALGISIAAQNLVKDLKNKNRELTTRLKASVHSG